MISIIVMATRNDLKEKAKDYEVLSHELRLYILQTLKEHKEATWTGIVNSLEKLAQRRLNPNNLSFHLSRLIESGFVQRTVVSGEPKYVLTAKAKEFRW